MNGPLGRDCASAIRILVKPYPFAVWDTSELSLNKVDWRGISGLRKVLAQDYSGINLVRVREVIEHGLPALKANILAVMRGLGLQDWVKLT